MVQMLALYNPYKKKAETHRYLWEGKGRSYYPILHHRHSSIVCRTHSGPLDWYIHYWQVMPFPNRYL